ncbi:MAG: hypothetical protein K2N94_16745, partial [Lachnospiraceae bacterium]|nr:hypothetical protein [Lachnospiraceae bacterium]
MRKKILSAIFAALLAFAPVVSASAAALPEPGDSVENPGDAEPGTEDTDTAPDAEDGTGEPGAGDADIAPGAEDGTGEPGAEDADIATDTEGGDAAPEGSGEEANPGESFAVNPNNYVDVDVIDLSLHGQETGEFT